MKHFDEELRRLHKNHWHPYPRTPKMNAHVERFNRTIQEEFIDYHEELLLIPDQFNRQLIPWLIWYNAERPHWALQLNSSLQFLLKQNPALCNSWRPNTASLHSPARFVKKSGGVLRAYLANQCEFPIFFMPFLPCSVVALCGRSAVSRLFFNAANISTTWPVRRGAGAQALISSPPTFFSIIASARSRYSSA
jgi:hypothetical protein